MHYAARRYSNTQNSNFQDVKIANDNIDTQSSNVLIKTSPQYAPSAFEDNPCVFCFKKAQGSWVHLNLKGSITFFLNHGEVLAPHEPPSLLKSHALSQTIHLVHTHMLCRIVRLYFHIFLLKICWQIISKPLMCGVKYPDVGMYHRALCFLYTYVLIVHILVTFVVEPLCFSWTSLSLLPKRTQVFCLNSQF